MPDLTLTTCPTCGGDPAHAPKDTPAAYDARVTIHHPGPAYRYPVTVYVKVTVPAGDDTHEAVAEAAMAAVGAVHDTRLKGVKVGWSKDRYGTFSDEPKRPESLPCGCTDLDEHNEGVALQAKYQKSAGRNACVGCFIGDDGPSMHSCVIHERRYWPKAVAS